MAEIVIKRVSTTYADSKKRIRGCYKRGDIIDILDDGLADTMPHLTVLKIPKLDKKDVSHFKESRKEFLSQIFRIKKAEYTEMAKVPSEKAKDGIITNSLENTETVYQTLYGMTNKLPTSYTLIKQKVKDEDSIIDIELDVFDVHTRRRYAIPESLMNSWFSNNKTQKELTIAEWNTIKTQLVDKTNG